MTGIRFSHEGSGNGSSAGLALGESCGMVDLVFGICVALGFALALAMREVQRRLLGSTPPPRPERLPAVSILKPLKGADENLEGNLESFFRLSFPDYELLFGVAEPDDPALPIVCRLIERYPDVTAEIVVDSREVGINPKVNNLANLAGRARHGVLLISDSNVLVGEGYLLDLVSHLERPEVGLVSSPIRGVEGHGLGGALEALQLNTFVMGGVSVLDNVRLPCVVGKSMLFRREHLEAIGGFSFLGQFLAEDQVFAEEMRRRKLRIAVSGVPVDNVLGRLTVPQFAKRHVRWARIRRRIAIGGYIGELLLNPTALALIGAAVSRTEDALALAGVTLLGMSILDGLAEQNLKARRPFYHYPYLELIRSMVVIATWPIPFLTRRVSWRGTKFRIGPRTRLLR